MVLTFRPSQPAPLSSLPDPDPADVERLAREAAQAANQGMHGKALKLYQMALLADEARGDLWYHYGSLQRQLGLLSDAQESFECALRIDSTMYTARYRLARVLCDMRQPLQAIEHFRIVTEQRPNYLPAWRYLVQLTWATGNVTLAQMYARDALRQAGGGDAEIEALLRGIVADSGGRALAA